MGVQYIHIIININFVMKKIGSLYKYIAILMAVKLDKISGTFRVSQKGEGPRCFAWTRRGLDVAATEALRALWGWHFKLTGEQCPFPL